MGKSEDSKRRLSFKLAPMAAGDPNLSPVVDPAFAGLNKEQLNELTEHLVCRLKRANNTDQTRRRRFMLIDRQLSTWLKHTVEDSERLKQQAETGQNSVVQANLPIMATHLEDVVALFTETLTPTSAPFITTSNDDAVAEILKRLALDVAGRRHEVNVSAASRAMIKYNLGGVHVYMDHSGVDTAGLYGLSEPGVAYDAVDVYNLFWDPAVTHPGRISTQAEWAAVVDVVPRAVVLRRAASRFWVNLDEFCQSQKSNRKRYRRGEAYDGSDGGVLSLWFDSSSILGDKQGMDDTTTEVDYGKISEATWEEMGLGMSQISGLSDSDDKAQDQHEITTMYCLLIPDQFGLLTAADREALILADVNPESFLEIWKFTLLDNQTIVAAAPKQSRKITLEQKTAQVIPIFVDHLIQDELRTAQRSQIELLAPFQRLMSALYGIGIESLRKNVWGTKVIDPGMFDAAQFAGSSTSQVITSKMPGVDIRAGLIPLNDTGSAEKAFEFVASVDGFRRQLFPSQAMPAQVAGLDRAISSQVNAVVHGAQRAIRTWLRAADTTVHMPARIEAVRLVRAADPTLGTTVSDEVVARSLGSGIEGLESERIVDAMWKLLMGIVQNQEAMQTFNVPKIFRYIGRIMRINVDLGDFVNPPPEPQGAPPGGVPPGPATPQQ